MASVEAEIAKHLTENVYTDEHFSLLRLVGGMSKRVCGLIEQSIKWVHTKDGKKERQKLRAGSKQNAPTIFSLAGINAADARAEEESGLKLKDHADRAGADICGKENALDHAMLQSIERTTRSGGMATKGTKEEPHLMCMTGDGAGSTDAKSSVRVGHFPGTTKLGGATRGPAGTSRASAGSREKRRPL